MYCQSELVEILQNFVAFSEYMNFKLHFCLRSKRILVCGQVDKIFMAKKPQLINEAIADCFLFLYFSWKSIHIPQTSELRHKYFETISVFDKKRWIDICLKVLKDPPNLKVTKSQNVFHLNLHEMLQNHYPEHLLFGRIVFRTVIWHFLFEIWAKVKNFLRLSNFISYLIYFEGLSKSNEFLNICFIHSLQYNKNY